jgi:hypothetical protein
MNRTVENKYQTWIHVSVKDFNTAFTQDSSNEVIGIRPSSLRADCCPTRYKIYCFYGIRISITVFIITRLWVLLWSRSMQTSLNFSQIHFNINLQPTLDIPSCLFFPGFSYQFWSENCACYMSHPRHYPRFDDHNNIWWRSYNVEILLM